MHCRVRSVVAAVVLLTVGVVSAQQSLSRRDADLMERKIATIVSHANAKPAKTPKLLRTSFTENEVNAYLKFRGKEQLPAGVVDPWVSIAGERRVTGRAIVDLDAVRKSKPRSWFDPAAYLTGSVEVKATGTLQTANGKGTFQLESATVGSLPVPKSVLQELVSYYSRTPETPDGFDLDKPFELPASIREVEIQRGAATIIQ
jgi:hypothetical protein